MPMRSSPSTTCPKSMSFAESRTSIRSSLVVLGFFLLICTVPAESFADDDFSLDMEELEKKDYEFGGFAELDWEHFTIRDDGAFTFLNLGDSPDSSLDRLSATLQLEGSYTKGITRLNLLAQAAALTDELDSSESIELFEAYAAFAPASWLAASVGKKSYKWGKGYAWNPVGFLNRMKDPNNPDDALEGFVTAETEFIKSFSGDLRNMALTAAVLPVAEDLNDDFGAEGNVNIAAKLYLLYLDTDFDFIAYTGNSLTSRYGFDFSRNITTNFEIHGEFAYFTDLERTVILADGRKARETADATSFLAGIRHLTSWDLTSIVEYYYNGGGYTVEEMDLFYQKVGAATEAQRVSGLEAGLTEAEQLAKQGYGRPYAGKDYLYIRLSQKEPFDILYFTTALTTIVNLDDQSFSTTPELLYTGFTNWELLMRFAFLTGDQQSEYGEKQNSNKVELRVRYFF